MVTDYDTPDGTCIRDYVHVTDIADAHSKAGEMLLNGDYSGVTMNLGTGKGHSILEVITELEKITNQKITYKVNPRRSGDAASLIADITLAKQVLNFEPKYDMMTMLQTAYNWQQKNDN
jgi:UDP-glucose 4-epimerase